jgi:S-adenosyl-L-methionine hydrolase (adenosine-forming)
MENRASSTRIITLLTDFGSQDYFVAAMKGAILSINPEARIVDITHNIPPQDIQAGAFNLLACYRDFPSETIHVAVVDPGVGSKRRPIGIECAGQFFVGPDNGIFSWICEKEGNCQAFHLTNQTFFRHPVSATFHGRDIFAPVAAALSKGKALEEFGPAVGDLISLESLKPRIVSDNRIDARIIHIDRFGNCLSNLTGEMLGDDPSGLRLEINDHSITSFRRYFAEPTDQDENEIFCLIGSAGFVEIVARNASAAKTLAASRGQAVTLWFQKPWCPTLRPS